MTYVAKGALISRDGRYRYRLWREWRLSTLFARWNWWRDETGQPVLDGSGHPIGEPKTCLFVMLNPSTADGDVDDPTIRRCVGFALRLKYERLEVVNLFAYRATSPRDLMALNDIDEPVGIDNQRHVETAALSADRIICAWGAHGAHLDQDETVFGWLPLHKPKFCFGLPTKAGAPRHPLYLAANAPLREYRGRTQEVSAS